MKVVKAAAIQFSLLIDRTPTKGVSIPYRPDQH